MLIVLYSQPDQFVASGCVRAHIANVKCMIEENSNSSYFSSSDYDVCEEKFHFVFLGRGISMRGKVDWRVMYRLSFHYVWS